MNTKLTTKQREIIIILISALFVFTFLFVSIDKWRHFDQFQKNMHNQPISQGLASLLVDKLPATELIVAILLLINRTRRFGLWLSTILMVAFTGYVAMIIANQFEYIPCSCAGILQNISWKSHLLLNIGLLLAGITALWMYPKKVSNENKINVQVT